MHFVENILRFFLHTVYNYNWKMSITFRTSGQNLSMSGHKMQNFINFCHIMAYITIYKLHFKISKRMPFTLTSPYPYIRFSSVPHQYPRTHHLLPQNRRKCQYCPVLRNIPQFPQSPA